jgi:hypothetical protein
MAGKDIAVKRYVVRLSAQEREQLQALVRRGKGPARRLLKARILLKADVSEGGPGWSDSKIIAALDTSASMLYRVTTAGRGVRGGVEPQAACDACGGAHFRRREGGQADRTCLLQTAERTCALDAAAVGEQGCGTRHRRSRATQRSIARLKKPSQTASPAVLGHPAEGQQRVRSRNGRCARRLHAAA